MEKERKIKILSICALIIAILGLTVAFAFLSETLTINGTAGVDTATWDVHFENQTRYESSTKTSGDAKFLSTPVLSENSITDINVSLTKPGDLAYFYFNIVNDGTINAKLSKEYINSFDLQTEPTEEDMLEILRSIFVEADFDGDGMTSDDELKHATEVFEFGTDDNYGSYAEDIIKPGEEHGPVGIYFKYKNEATKLPKGDVTININSWTFVYTQTD